MKVLKYNLIASNEDGEETKGPAVTMEYSEANQAIAEREAYHGEVIIEDDGQPESEREPTEAERISELEEAMELLLSGVTQ